MKRSHAYIFEGEDTEAVRKEALEFAKSINCAEPQSDFLGCGKCLSCRTFDSGNHPDTIFVKGSKQKGIGVDDAREQIVMPMAVKPFKYEYKIFIIDEPILPAAQNALLKTIEEPAPYGIFLFIARNTHDFLPTVLSRCVVQKFRGFSDFRGENSFLQSLAEEIADSVKGADIPEAFSLYKKIEHLEKNELQKFLDLLYIHCGKKFRQNINQKYEFEEIIKTKKILSQNGNAQLAIELMLLKMR